MSSPLRPTESDTPHLVAPPMSSPRSKAPVLIVGDYADPEVMAFVTDAQRRDGFPGHVLLDWDDFAVALDSLADKHASVGGDAASAGNRQGVAEALTDWHLVRLVAFVRSERSQHSARLIDVFGLANPLIAVAEFYGPWCQGESRSGSPATQVRRLPISRMPTELPRMAGQIAERGWCEWHVPRAIHDDDQGLDSDPARSPLRGRHIGVVSSDNETLQTLSAMVQRWGVTVQAWRASDSELSQGLGERKFDAWVVDCRFAIDEALSFQSFQKAEGASRVPFVAILGFGRERDRQRLRQSLPGASLVDKPFREIDLLAALCAAMGQVATVSR